MNLTGKNRMFRGKVEENGLWREHRDALVHDPRIQWNGNYCAAVSQCM